MNPLCQPMDFPASEAFTSTVLSLVAFCVKAGVRASLLVIRPTPYAGITR